MPDAHPEEERNRYSEEELKAAAEQESLLPETAGEEIPDRFKVRELSAMPEINPEVARSLLSEGEQTELSGLYDFLKVNYSDIDFIDDNNPLLQQTLDFQNRVLDLFKRWISILLMITTRCCKKRSIFKAGFWIYSNVI
jgi:hypothetical protein